MRSRSSGSDSCTRPPGGESADEVDHGAELARRRATARSDRGGVHPVGLHQRQAVRATEFALDPLALAPDHPGVAVTGCPAPGGSAQHGGPERARSTRHKHPFRHVGGA